jgi:hypothetical protein
MRLSETIFLKNTGSEGAKVCKKGAHYLAWVRSDDLYTLITVAHCGAVFRLS